MMVNMIEKTYEWIIKDFTEIAIRGADNNQVYISVPRWTLNEVKYPIFSSTIHIGKRRISHSFRSDDIEATLKVIKDGGEEKEVANALSTNEVFVNPLMKHCKKIIGRAEKASERLKKKNRIIVKKSSTKKPESYTKPTNSLKVNLNTNVTTSLNAWI